MYQFQPDDIERVCETLSCSRAQLARTLGVSRACVSRWEKGLRAPQGGDAARLRTMVGKHEGPAIDVFDLRAKLGMTQRVFGAQFGVSRQQVQKWESGAAVPHRSHLDKLVKLVAASATVPAPLTISRPDMLTVGAAAAYSGITEKTIRKAVKDGRLAHTVDTSPGPWPRQGRYLIRRSDLEEFKTNRYDPFFKKGRWLQGNHEPGATPAILAFDGLGPLARKNG
ncbi:MAG TPA: helix-turn-helix domain-containing protein [Vicinamibacterales bacterium]|nr:helix-turn-helix domain-containing protein [Vicinamibacterales bacterium]